MYAEDVTLLHCPASGEALRLLESTQVAPDGEIVEGTLGTATKRYPITNGIPRFVEDVSANPTWDFKWRVLDAGRGLNFRIIDKSDSAYTTHDIYDRNNHDGAAYKHMNGGLVLDIGCGVGQYAVRSLLENNPRKLVAIDLTSGVDVFRKVVQERYPQLMRRLLIVQANVFALPFAPATFDYVYSLGVLMHTGQTLTALDRACAMVKEGGEINVWIYGSEMLAYNAFEPGRQAALSIATVRNWLKTVSWPAYWIKLFREIHHDRAFAIVKFFSSDRMYRLAKRPRFRWIARVFPTVDHPDYAYRLINNYDGYINKYDDTWGEHELFPVLRRHSIALLGLGSWRVGLWGRKISNFYPAAAGADSES